MTRDGLKPIEAIREGDIVLARDEETGEQVWREVIGTLSKMHETVLVLDFEAEDGEQTQIITTDDHPFYVRGQGWTEAGQLKKGLMLQAANGFVRLTGSTSVAKRQLAYDLTVDSSHTFFVGEAQIWVHNCEAGPKDVKRFESKRAAFRAAKRDAGIPTSQSHSTHRKNLKADASDSRRTATEYDFGGGQKVQDHPAGHKFPDGERYDKPHFNNHGKGGTKRHYEYE